MELIAQSISVYDPSNKKEWIRQMRKIEHAYRICYGHTSEEKMTDDSYLTFIPKYIKHGSPLEHTQVTVLLDCSRAIQQELTRHRLASYSIESTRWIDYFKKQGGQVQFIQPADWDKMDPLQRDLYFEAMKSSEDWYNKLREAGLPSQRARDAFALGLKSKIMMSANVREWRHVFELRALNKSAHPDIRQLTQMILMRLADEAPPLFADLLEVEDD